MLCLIAGSAGIVPAEACVARVMVAMNEVLQQLVRASHSIAGRMPALPAAAEPRSGERRVVLLIRSDQREY